MGIVSERDFIERVRNLSEISFKPGERNEKDIMDSHDLRYLKSGDFCANLHIHTIYSDGVMTVPELVKYTNEIPNMLTAITDHDTVEGAKELVKLNPSVDICAGIEISTVGINFPKQPKPLSIHLLVYGIDPFDERLNEFLDKKSRLKLELASKTVEELNIALPKYKFSLEEASKCHPMIMKGQDEVSHPLKKYTSGKILKEYYFPNETFSYEQPIYEYKYLFTGAEPYFITYKRALQMFTNTTLPLIPDEIINDINKAKEVYSSAHPKIGKMLEAFSSFEETVEFISNLKSGVMSIAHPARTKAYRPEFYNYLFYNFKKYGKNKAMFFEKYYQSYEGSYFLDWCDIINKAGSDLIPTGGLDSHGHSIVYRGANY